MAFNFDELTSITREYFLPTVVDQIFSKDPILNMVKQGKKVVNGGRMFSVPIKVDTLNRGVFQADAAFDVTKKEIINRFDIPVKGYYSNLTIDTWDESLNSGNAAVVNLLKEKMADLEESMRQNLLDGLYGDPAVVDPTGKGMDGLEKIVSATNVYGGINRSLAEHDYFRSVVVEDATGSAPIALTYDVLRKFFMDVTNGGRDRNVVFVGDFGSISKIEKILADRNQITTVKEKEANLGFENFTLFGRPVHNSAELEVKAQAEGKGILYAINFDYLQLHTLKGNDFRLTGFKKDRNSELSSQQLIVMGNLVATKPKALGKITDISLA